MAGTIDFLKGAMCFVTWRMAGHHQLIHLCCTLSLDKLELGLQITAKEQEEQHICLIANV